MKKIGLAVLTVVAPVAALALYVAARHLVYWSPSEEVAFSSGDVRLAGTLVRPSGEGPFPAVVLLHGSGPEPRSDPPTRAVVNALVRTGFAALLYDKRGVGASGGDFESATYRDFVDDAVAAIDYLRGRTDVDVARIGLYAVSESGWLAPEIAARTRRVAFIFNKVGPPLSWVDTVRWEVRGDYLAEGVAEADVQPLVDLALRRWAYYQAAAADPSLAAGPERDALERRIAKLRAEIPGADRVVAPELLPYDADDYAAFAAVSTYDPTPFLRALDVPLYYAFGELDVNVPTRQAVAALEALVRDHGKNVTVKVYPGVGHSLATWKGLLDVGFPPGYLETLAAWTAEQVR